MRVTGIIAEYNPLHNGHAYHIREARRLTGCDYLIVAMSGDFVQRGMPAIMDRYIRAEAALLAGADMVVELPVYTATGSAEYFARGGISTLRSLGVVTHLSYGMEVPEGQDAANTQETLKSLAAYLANEPDEYREALRAFLGQGLSFPAARAAALKGIFPEQTALLDTPNNILALEYEKQCLLQHASFESVPVSRTDDGYHSEALRPVCSATAIRNVLYHGGAFPSASVPEAVHALYASPAATAVFPDDFSDVLFTKLQAMSRDDIAAISDIGNELANRIYKATRTPFSFTALGNTLKERSHTRTHIDRALCHILLGITQELAQDYHALSAPPYLQVLGIRSSFASALGHINKQCTSPLLVRMARDTASLSEAAGRLYATEERASSLYAQVLYRRSGIVRSDNQKRFLILP